MSEKPMTTKEIDHFLVDLNHITDPNIPAWLVDGAKRVAHLLRETLASTPEPMTKPTVGKCYACASPATGFKRVGYHNISTHEEDFVSKPTCDAHR